MRLTKLQEIWASARRSDWFLSIISLIPNLIISLAWTFGPGGGIAGFIVSFVAIEGLVILINAVARPVIQAQKLLASKGFLEVDTPDAKVLVGKIRAELPPSESSKSWRQVFPKFKDAWIGLINESEGVLRADRVTADDVRALTDTLASTSAQIRAGRAFEIHTLKRAAGFLGHPEGAQVTKVMVINRIAPVLWFTPEMVVYTIELFKLSRDHPKRPRFIRLSIVDEEEFHRINDRNWQLSLDVDPLKCFVAVNQMAGVHLKVLTEGEFNRTVERFMNSNAKSIKGIQGADLEELMQFIKDMAFIMYCKGRKPIMAFRGRPVSPYSPRDQHGEPVITWPEIIDTAQRTLYYAVFVALDQVAHEIPELNLAQAG